MTLAERLRVFVYSVLLLGGFLLFWQHVAKPATDGTSSLPSPVAVFQAGKTLLAHPFYDHGSNDLGIGYYLRDSLVRLGIGYGLASVVAIALGTLLGLSPLLYRAVNPYIQILKPVSPIAWIPLFIYGIKDSGKTAILAIFISALWPTLANTAFAVNSIRRDYLSVAAMLQLPWTQRLFRVILPAAAPTIIAGMRISLGSAWVAIVAVEALLSSPGIGYFLWNEYNNLNLDSVILSIILIGLLGVFLDLILGGIAKKVTYAE